MSSAQANEIEQFCNSRWELHELADSAARSWRLCRGSSP